VGRLDRDRDGGIDKWIRRDGRAVSQRGRLAEAHEASGDDGAEEYSASELVHSSSPDRK
jgi:hypothetical protein